MLDLEVLQTTNNSPPNYEKGPSGNKKVIVIKVLVKRIKHMKGGKYINLQLSIFNLQSSTIKKQDLPCQLAMI